MEYGCIGERLSHSFSKTIHNRLFDYTYELKEIPKDGLDRFMRRADFKAINVTIPYKQAVIPYLDEIDETAREIGAVNTVVNRGGRLSGFNTDFFGMNELIKRQNIVLKGKKVLILGSGGTSKTAYCVAKHSGASEILRVSRSGGEGLISYAEAQNVHSDAGIIINTTPCGMFPNIGRAAVALKHFGRLSGVVDAVYNPLKTELVCQAESRGIPAVGGLYMLIAQAAAAAEKFTGTAVPKEACERIYGELLLEKRNLVLVGMPGCGKTVIGRAVAEALGKEFFDSDEELVKRYGISISEFFEKFGEKKFREAEAEVIEELSLKQGCVTATGGGAVLNGRNVELLKENGTVLFIDRPLEMLVATSDRPLSSNREMLEKRYAERYGIYTATADITVRTDSDITENARRVREAFINENIGNKRT